MDIFPKVFSRENENGERTCRIPLTDDEREFCRLGARPPKMSDLTWRIFRIMAELVEGFQFLSTTSREVSIFGGARSAPSSHWYNEAVKLGKMLGEQGYTVVTGGGPGIMEAANRGAHEAGATSIGLNIQLPREQRTNPYVSQSRAFHYFFTRKLMLAASAQTYVFFPGGYGTLDELFEIITLIQTRKSEQIPVVLVGKTFWEPLISWLTDNVYGKHDAIDKADLQLFTLVDTAEEAYTLVSKSRERSLF